VVARDQWRGYALLHPPRLRHANPAPAGPAGGTRSARHRP
jgi:hypothetical protein